MGFRDSVGKGEGGDGVGAVDKPGTGVAEEVARAWSAKGKFVKGNRDINLGRL
jgi:hypothetical protein